MTSIENNLLYAIFEVVQYESKIIIEHLRLAQLVVNALKIKIKSERREK
ncbi:MAG: hypothetical protein IKF38_01060 [Clostridia bacterium]|nr:hypothetical protein [Clostridia bacterium]